MTIQWGAYDTAPSPGGTSGLRVGIEVTNTAVSNSSSSVTFTFKVYTQNYLAYTGDSQGLTFGGGGGSGSVSFSNSSATGAVVLRATRTYTYNYPSTSYGSSPGGISFSATSTGAFDGTNASKSIVATVPARPYAVPARPTGVLITRNSDTQATLTWSRAATTGAPYTSQTIQYRYWTGTAWSAWMTAATATSTATSYVRTGLQANNIYQFQIRANNSVGSSIYTASNGIMMTPAAPSNVVSAVSASGTQITTTWTRNHVVPYSPYVTTYTIQRSVNGAAYAALASGITTESYTDNSPGAGTNRYKVLATTTYPPNLSSAYVEGNTVSTIVPPLAPTLLTPNGAVVDLTQPLTFTWQHNPGADGAAQTMFRLQYSANGGGTWQNLVSDVASSAGTYTMPGGTLPNQATPYQWQIRTMGVASAGYGPYSTTATFTGSSAPTTNITAPTASTTAIPLTVTWTYAQAQSSPQAQWWVTLFADDGVTVLETKTGTGTALSTTFAYAVEDGKTYYVQQQSKSAAGVLSAVDTQVTTISLPVPAPATVTPEYQPCTGTMALHLEGLAPASVVGTRTNLLLNPGPNLPSGSNWASNSAGGTAAISYPVEGESPSGLCAKLSWTVAATTPSAQLRMAAGTGTSGRPVVAGTTYPVMGTFKTSMAGQTWALRAAFYTAAGASISDVVIASASPDANTTFSLSGTVVAPATAAFVLPYLGQTGGPNMGVGEWVRGWSALLEAAATVTNYFDGSTPDISTVVYSWTGAAGASTSTAVGRSEVAAIAAIVERRINGGEWVKLGQIALPNDLIDTVPLTNGLNEYRATSVSSVPSYNVGPAVEAYGTDGQVRGNCDQWVFVSYGPGFSNILRTHSNLKITSASSRVRASQAFLGRKKPRLAVGQNTNKEIGVQATLHWDDFNTVDDDCYYDSPPIDWETMSEDADIVCYRDYTGRRIFGMLSDVNCEEVRWRGWSSVSFSVTEDYYVEAYGEAVG